MVWKLVIIHSYSIDWIDHKQGTFMNLLRVGSGKWIRVISISGGGGLDIKLRNIGFMPGDYARVIRQAPFGGPVLLEISGRELALGQGIARKIEVEECTPPCDLC